MWELYSVYVLLIEMLVHWVDRGTEARLFYVYWFQRFLKYVFVNLSMATTPTHRSGSFRSLPPKSRWGAQQFRAGEARKRHLQEQRPGCERLVH